MQQLLGAVHDVHPRRSRWLLVLFHPFLNFSALTSERQDSGASGFPLILPTLIGWFPKTTVPLPLLSENRFCAAELTLGAAVAFGAMCPSWTVVIGPDIHL